MVPARAAPARKGIYVIPVSVTELVGSESYRNYVLSLHRQLRSRGIAEHLILFDSAEAKPPPQFRCNTN